MRLLVTLGIYDPKDLLKEMKVHRQLRSTVTHPVLRLLDTRRARRDVVDGRGQEDRVVNRPLTIAVCAACVLVVLLGGCVRKGPLSVRFGRQVDQAKLVQLPRQSGSVVLLVDAAFWTDQQRVRRIPVVRREKTFIIGPGAAEMADKMLSRMFDEVVDVRRLDRVEDPERFDFVIRLVHESFDDRTILLPLFSRQRYQVDLAAEVSRLDGSFLAKVDARGSQSFWIMGLSAADLFEGDQRLLGKASKTLNAAVQESLFGLMDELGALSIFSEDGH